MKVLHIILSIHTESEEDDEVITERVKRAVVKECPGLTVFEISPVDIENDPSDVTVQ